MSTTTKDSRYEFDKVKHIHTLDGKPLTGVTIVLSVISKPALIQWAANMAVEYIKDHATVRGEKTSIIPNSILDEAKTAHAKKRDKAGDWGTEVHAWIENWVMSQILDSGEVKLPSDEFKQMACQNFVTWAIGNKVIFKESEKNIYSEGMWIGGIVDLVAEIDGKIWICDIKTSSGIYPEAFFQMSAYDMCLKEMGLYKDIEGHIVLNLRKDGVFEEKRSISNEENKEAFKACLTIYRTREKIKNQVI